MEFLSSRLWATLPYIYSLITSRTKQQEGENMVKGAKGAQVKIIFQLRLHMTCVIFVLVYKLKKCILGTPLTLHFRYK
jgi:hypothetical protein